VFRLLAEGKRVEEVADILNISQKTVANYYTIIRQKLNVASPVEMVRVAMKHGLIES
jgi:DNA-binding NarL/FixJ family response regulator